MTWSRAACLISLLLLCVLGGSGCDPRGSNALDEQKDPHFLTGKSRVKSLDYDGAILAFQEALKRNPISASAHKELGILFYERKKDYAAAIYHFNKLLELRPNDEHADAIKQFITNSKQELAREVSILPVNQAVQRDLQQLDKLTKENTQLKEQIQVLQAQLAHRLQQPVASTNRPVYQPIATNVAPVARTNTVAPPRPTLPAGKATANATQGTTTAARKTYVVKSGDTPSTIARQCGVRLDALLAANPGLDPRKLKVGQVLKLPEP